MWQLVSVAIQAALTHYLRPFHSRTKVNLGAHLAMTWHQRSTSRPAITIKLTLRAGTSCSVLHRPMFVKTVSSNDAPHSCSQVNNVFTVVLMAFCVLEPALSIVDFARPYYEKYDAVPSYHCSRSITFCHETACSRDTIGLSSPAFIYSGTF